MLYNSAEKRWPQFPVNGAVVIAVIGHRSFFQDNRRLPHPTGNKVPLLARDNSEVAGAS